MSLTQPEPLDAQALVEKAEEVRAYVVAIRGGAPFLSAADGRLLVKWLEAGISVARILAAVDEVASKRRKKRTRGRLSLSSCRRSIEGRSRGESAQAAPARAPSFTFEPFAADLAAMPVRPELMTDRDRLVTRIGAIDLTQGPEHAAAEAVIAVRLFQEAAWSASQSRLEGLRAQARQELSALANILSAEALAAAIDEVCRDLIRQETPLVSAAEVWDRVSAS